MATSSTNLRSRRTEAQLHALAGVEREIRANDPNGRRKYLRDFSQAYRRYESVLDTQQLTSLMQSASILLIGDYHALPAAQRYAATVLEERVQPGDRPVVLGVETIFARDQHILEEWWRREIDEQEFRERIRFDLDWGYDWAPFYELLVTAREHGEAIYGLDCMPREDLRKIGARDRHAATKIAEIRQRHPNAVILVLFGESHLAPGHLPQALHEQLPSERTLTVLQNIDALYWLAAGERQTQVQAVQVRDGVVCVFNSTPLEKYENYRLHLSRWCRDRGEGPDFAPTIYNLVGSLSRFLDIRPYSPHNGTQPKFLVDSLPEVYGPSSQGRWERLLALRVSAGEELDAIQARIEETGCIYLPEANAVHVREFQMMYSAEEAARFLHHACRGLPRRGAAVAQLTEEDKFYVAALERALGHFGSRILYPSRPVVEENNVTELTRKTCEAMQKDSGNPQMAAERLGYRIGNRLYDLYVSGKITRHGVRRLFLAHLEEAGRAKETCLQLVSKIRRCRSARFAQNC
jgi:Haem-binding uptake, Tiki superfamily, ChaN